MARKQDLAYAYLRNQILEGKLLPGQRIVARQVAEAIGVSGVPVREALLKLQAEKLITTTPHTASIVAFATTKETIETLEVLSLLEGYVTRLAAPKARPILTRLRAINRDLKRLCGERDWHRVSRVNRDFHEEIYTSCDNVSLIATIRTLWDQIDFFMSTTSFYLIPDRAAKSIREHDEIIQMLAAPKSNPVKLELVAREHGLRTARQLARMKPST